MDLVKLNGTNLKVSPFCLGTMQFGSRVTGDAVDPLFSVFRDGGGNFFDTAHCYCFWDACGDGASERILGSYVNRHGIRDQVVIATKGAHPAMPNYRRNDEFLTAGRIEADIDDSLARLQVDEIDLYWLHRDDPRVPAGEIIDILNQEVERGRIRYFGGSNWTSPRLAEANAYAAGHQTQGFVASQPLWNLAAGKAEPEGEKRLEPGVLLSLSAEDAQWHHDSQLPVIPYAPTANGFFATNGKIAERWQHAGGSARLARSRELATQLGATPNQIALAWLLHQPFPVIPILGTSNPDHLRDGLDACRVTLTAEQVRWLRNG